MKKTMVLPVLLILLLPSAAFAHKMKLFATRQGAVISGYVYYPGGGRAQQVAVQLFGPERQLLQTVTTDEQGTFIFDGTAAGAYELVCDTGDGHMAHGAVTAPAAIGDSAGVGSGETATGVGPSEGDEAMFRRIIDEEMTPLREALQAQADNVRIRDVLGGLGYIIGLAGLWMFWNVRKRR